MSTEGRRVAVRGELQAQLVMAAAMVVDGGTGAPVGLLLASRRRDEHRGRFGDDLGRRGGEIGDDGVLPWAAGGVACTGGVARVQGNSRDGEKAAGGLRVARGGGAGSWGRGNGGRGSNGGAGDVGRRPCFPAAGERRKTVGGSFCNY